MDHYDEDEAMSSRREATNSEPIQYEIESARRNVADDEPKRPRPKALLVVHGMGQQMRFDTIDLLVRGMDRAGIKIEHRGGRTVRLNGMEPVQRAELVYATQKGNAELHVYEGYWAPLTQGQVTARNVMGFLVSAAWNGIRKGRHKFHRWLFHRDEEFVIPGSTVVEVALAVFVLGALGIVNLVAAGVLVSNVWSGRVNVPLLRDVQAVLTMMLANLGALALVILVCLGLAPWLRRARWLAHTLSAVGFVTLFGACSALVAGALVILAAVAQRVGGDEVRAMLEALDWVVAISFGAGGLYLVLAGMAASRLLRGWRGLAALLGGVGAAALVLSVLTTTAAGYRGLVACSGGKLLLLLPPDEPTTSDCLVPPAKGSAEKFAPMSLWDQWFDPHQLKDTMRDHVAARSPTLPVLVVLAFVLATACFHSQQRLRRRRGGEGNKIHASALEIVGVVLAAASSPLLVYLVSQRLYRWIVDFFEGPVWGDNTFTLLAPFLALLVASWWIRGFIVQFVGDVAAYVASFRLDRFHKLRREIQETCASVARTIYGLSKDGELVYESVALVGHSLGSVVAYDTLNRMLLESKLDRQRESQAEPEGESPDDGQRESHDVERREAQVESRSDWPVVREVQERTRLLLTFGSPLNKVTYLFSAFSSADSARNGAKGSIREMLASSLQPLIDDAECRQSLAWVNVWSPNDIISGRLEYFDPPHGPAVAPTVENGIDEDAVVPLAAHTEYWDTTAIYRHLATWLGATPSATAARAGVRTPVATQAAASHP